MGQPQRPHTRRVERDVMRAVWRHLGHSILMELLAIGDTSFLQAFRAGVGEGAEDVPVLRDKAAGIRAAAPVAAGIALTGETVRHRRHLLPQNMLSAPPHQTKDMHSPFLREDKDNSLYRGHKSHNIHADSRAENHPHVSSNPPPSSGSAGS